MRTLKRVAAASLLWLAATPALAVTHRVDYEEHKASAAPTVPVTANNIDTIGTVPQAQPDTQQLETIVTATPDSGDDGLEAIVSRSKDAPAPRPAAKPATPRYAAPPKPIAPKPVVAAAPAPVAAPAAAPMAATPAAKPLPVPAAPVVVAPVSASASPPPVPPPTQIIVDGRWTFEDFLAIAVGILALIVIVQMVLIRKIIKTNIATADTARRAAELAEYILRNLEKT